MLVLSYPKKDSALFAGMKKLRFKATAMLLILMILSGMANAQAPSVTINPGGGETATDGLRITITDSSVMVRRNGVDQFSLDATQPRYDQGGLRTYVIFQNKIYGTFESNDPLYLKACNISDIAGEGTETNPWRVVTQTRFKNANNADYNLSTEYVYTAGKSYYLINYYLSSNEDLPDATNGNGGPYWVHFYLSEASWMGTETCGKGIKRLEVDVAVNDWHFESGSNGYIPRMVGITKGGSDCPDGLSGTHVFKTSEQGFISYYAGPVADRDVIAANRLLSNTIKAAPDESGITVHTALEMSAVFPGNIWHDSRQIAVGFDTTEMESLSVIDPNINDGMAIPAEVAEVTLTPVTDPSGAEGDDDHPITGMALNVTNATFELPQVLEIQVTPSGTYPAVEGTDYRVLYNKVIIPPGAYLNGQVQLPIEIIGNTTASTTDKTFTVTLIAPTCAPQLQLGTNISAEYTIVDDDENRLFLEPEKMAVNEGEKTKVKVRMSGTALGSDLTVNLNRLSASTAKTTDYSGMPATVTIPAGYFEAEFELTATGDLILEGSETLQIGATAIINTEPAGDSTEIIITDTTHLNPDNKVITFNAPQGAEGSSITLTASLPAGVTTEAPLAISINYNSQPGTTADFDDLSTTNFIPTVMTIPADGSQVSDNIDVLQDNVIEDQEFWYFEGTASDEYGAYSMIPTFLDILDDPAGREITITFAEASIVESGSPQQVGTVSLPSGFESESDIVFNTFLASGSTADQNDFSTLLPLTVTIPASANSATFNLNVPEENPIVIEGTENAIFTGSLSGFVFHDGSFQIVDSLPTASNVRRLMFVASTIPTEITEGETKTIKVKIEGSGPSDNNIVSQTPIPFTIAFAGGTASAGDYVLPATGEIPAMQNWVEFDFTATSDAIPEPAGETMLIRIIYNTTGSNKAATTPPIIIKDEVNNNIIFTSTTTTLLEGAPVTTVTASMESGTAPADIDIALSTGSGSTAGDEDYVVTPSTVTIPAGSSSVTFTIAAADDDILERDETLNLTGTATGYTFDDLAFTIQDATGTNPANKQITVEPDGTSVNEGSNVKVWVRLPTGITTSEEITITLAQGAGSDAGIQASDYTYAVPVKIPAGANGIDLTLQANSDNVLEPTERLELSASATVFDEPVTATGSVDIIDQSKTSANTTLVVTGPSTVTEGASVKYKIALPAGVTTAEPINITLAPLSAGTTTTGADFAGNVYPVSATINAGDTYVEVEFAAKSDAIVEGPEHLNMQFAATGFTFTQQVSLDVEDTDPAGYMIQLSASAATIAESGTTEITATLPGFTSATDIDVVLSRGAGSTAGSSDHGALGTIHIEAGESSAKVNISALGDDVLEGDEVLELFGSSGGYTVVGVDVTITDATGTTANKTITLSPATATVAEGNVVKIKASLPTGITSTQDITVTLAKGASSSTALTALDVTFPPTVTILAGDSDVEFDVTAAADLLIESSEVLNLTSSATVFGYTSTDESDITITDATDKTITVTGPSTIAEDANGTYKFSLPTGVTSELPITVTLTRDASSTADLADLQSLPSVVIPAGDEFVEVDFTPKDDDVIEPTENLVLTPSSTGYTFNQSVTFNITDGDLTTANITLSAGSVAEGSSAVITATLNGGVTSASNIVITLSKNASSTTENTEHGTLGTITINAGETTGTFTLTTNTDQLLEGSETVVVDGTNTDGITITGTTVTITDATGTTTNKTITLSPANATVAEGNVVKIKASLPTGITSTQDIVVALAKDAGSSTNLDLADVSFPSTVTILAGDSEIEFDVTAAADLLIESSEILNLTSSATVLGYASTDESDITITDATDKTITVTGPSTIAEAANGTYKFSLSTGVTSELPITVTLTRDASSTAELADLQSLPSVVIPAGDEFVEVDFTPKDDDVIEPTENMVLTPSSTGYTFNQSVTFNITDGDLAAAGITLSAAPASIAEGVNTVLTATLNGGVTSTSDITITLSKNAGSTAENSEHGALGTVTIDAGETIGTFTLTTSGDQLLEGNETVIVDGTNTDGITITGTTVTITDATGTAANKTITLSPATATVAEGNVVKIKASLPTGITSTQDIVVTLAKGAGSSTNLDLADVSFPSTVTILAGDSEVEFDVTAATDLLIESSEVLNLTSSATVFGYTSTDESDITITDATDKTITVAGPSTIAEGANGTYKFSLPTGVTSELPITVTLTRDASSTADLADLQGLPSVVIPAGDEFVEVDFTPKDDDVIEPTENMVLTPSATGYTFDQSVTFNITDGDLAAASITLLAAPGSIAEGVNTVLTATLNGGVTSANNIVITLSKNASSTAENTEHGALGVITINAGETTGTFTLTTSGDQLLEGNETVIVDGTNTDGITVTGTTVTITDATGTTTNKTITLSPATATIAEGGLVKIKASLPTGITSTQDITVTLAKDASSSTALTALDVTFPPTITILAGDSEVEFDVTAATDLLIESSEILKLTSSGTVFGYTSTDESDITITDATDKAITVTGPSTIAESANGTYKFSLPTGVTSELPITVTFTRDASSTADLTDLQSLPSVVIPAGDEFVEVDFTPKDDDVIEPTENMVLTPSATGYTFDQSVTFNITDGDLATANITLSAGSVAEGSSAVITATLNGGVTSASNIVIMLSKNVSSTAENTEHGTLGTITINAGETTGTFTLTTNTDQLLEGNETVVVDGTNTDGITITGTTVTITDATGTTTNKTITLSPANATVAEGGLVKIKASLPTGITSTQDITVTLAKGASSSTALTALDITFPPTVTILAGDSEVEFDVTAAADLLIESFEVLNLTSSATVFGYTSTDESDITITDATVKTITVTGPSTIAEGANGTYKFSLPTGVTSELPITVTLTRDASSTADLTDLQSLPSVVIPAGDEFVEVNFTPKDDDVIEPTENLVLTPSSTGYTFTQSVIFNITDGDLTTANITLSAGSVAEGSSAVITATLNGGVTSASNIVITLSKNASSTTENTEHGTLGTITINAGETTGTFTLATNGDQLIEPDETIIVDGTNTDGIPVTGTTITITDNTGPVNITLSPATTSVAEGNVVKLKASLPSGITSTQAITVSLSRETSSTAGHPNDVSFPSTITIAAGDTENEFDVTAETDNIIESSELLKLTAAATIAGHASSSTAGVTITDVSTKTITVTGPAVISEGNQAVFTFSLPTGVTSASPITVQLTQGSATPAVSDADIAGGIPSSVTIPAGLSSGTLSLDINTDAVIEPVEKLELTPSAPGYTLSGSIALDVQDANFGGAISFTSSNASISEGSGTATITVSLPGALTATDDITVTIVKDALSTAGAADHSALPASVTIKGGNHNTTFDITAANDNIIELLETLQLSGNAPGFSVSGVTVSIADATGLDPQNTVISLVPDNGSIAEDATGDFSVKLPDGIVSSTPVTVSLSKTAASSTAADTDHTQIPVSITIPAMSNASAEFDISAVKDGIIEPTETIRIDGIAPAGFSFPGADIQITDITGLDPANRLISITIDSTTLHEGNTSKVKLSLPAGITTATPIAINLAADPAFNAVNADFTITPAAVIAKDDREVTIDLTAIQDNTTESDETLRLAGIAAGFTVTPSAPLNIPGDPAPALNVTVVKTMDAAEPVTNGAFSIQLTGGATPPYDITVQYDLSGNATPDADFTALSGTAVIKAGASSVPVPLEVKNDKVVEGTENVQIQLTSASFQYFGNTIAATLDAVKTASMNITDDETAGDLSILIEKIADATEPATPGSVRVRFTQTDITATVPVTVTYTIDGSATPGTDYVSLTGTATIPAGKKEAVIAITPKDDILLEGTETVDIELTAASSPLAGITWPIAAQHSASVNLYDNDVITVELFTSATAAEGSGLSVTLKASEAPTVNMPVTISLQHDAFREVTANVPQTGSNLTVTIPAGQTEVSFTLDLVDNDTNDDNGFVNLTIQPHSGAGQSYGKGSSGNTTTAVTDNDALEISFSKDTAKVQEGNTGFEIMPVKVLLSRKSTREIVLEYEFADAFEGAGADKDPQRARAGEDFQDHVHQLVIPALSEEAEITVPVIGDIVHEADEYFAIRLKTVTVASGQQPPVLGTQRTAIGAIINDDAKPDFEIRVHKGVSPNGDGKNDVLIIENLEKYARNEIVIVNRWGGTIYSTSNYHNVSNNFNGQANKGSGSGKLLPDGSYFYVLHVWDGNGNMTRYTGYIVLKSAQ